jgi:hypothetical protein
MPVDSIDIDTNRRRPKETAIVSTSARRRGESPTFPTAREAVAELERRHGKRSAAWTYHDARGDPVGVVVRWDKPGGKDIRPVARRGDGWVIGGMPEPRPLYGLPDLARADRVYVTEGEPAADAARAIGLTATTSAHGSQSPEKTDWSPLAGKEVVSLPDNDSPGRKYTGTVGTILARLTPAPVVEVVELPGLPERGDMADFVSMRRAEGKSDEDIRAEVESLADAARPVKRAPATPPMLPWRPFPVDALPEPVRGFVVAGAKAIGCCASYIALAMLSALAAAIGNTRRIQLKRGWDEPAIVWTAIVGDSGTMKSPALELALRGVRERQRKAMAEHAQRMADYYDKVMRYERELTQWKKSKSRDDPPEKPQEPITDRCWCDDPTIEALAVLLRDQWRGLLMVRDELSGWIGGFDRYSQGKGGDVARWLEMFGGRSMLVDRKTGNPRTLYVPRAAVSVTGGIQPEILRRCLSQEYREDGLAARLLLTWPPRRPKRWTEADVSPEAEEQIAEILDQLYELQPTVTGDGDRRPVIVRLTRDGKASWARFYNEHAEEHVQLTGDLSAAWSKLEGYAARLALVIHFTRWATADPTLADPSAVDAESVEAGIRLSRWFGHEARRVYAMLDESDEDRARRKLIELIQRKGGSVAPRDLLRSSSRYRTADDAEAALEDLAKAGYGVWQVDDHDGGRGRPARRFVLFDTPDVDTNTTNREEDHISVNVNGISEAENTELANDLPADAGPEDSEDWGAI